MRLIVAVLNVPAASRLVQCHTHGGGYRVGVHNDLALRVSCGAANGLNQAGFAAQKALFIRIEDGHQTHLRQIQPLPQQVDANQHVKFCKAQITNDFHSLHCTHIGVHIPHPNSCLGQINRQIFRHFLCECRNQHPLLPCRAGVDFSNQIVNLAVNGANLHHGIQQAGRANHLLHNLAGAAALVLSRRCRNIDNLIDFLVKLPEIQRPVVISRGQAEAVVHQRILPAAVTGIHGATLRQGHMALIDEHQEILWEIIQQCGGRCARFPPLNHPRIIFDACAEADFCQHLQVIGRALGNALGFNQFIVVPKKLYLPIAFFLDFQHSPLQFFL